MSSTSLHVRPLEAGDTDTVHGRVRGVPDGWTAELASARVTQLLRAALA